MNPIVVTITGPSTAGKTVLSHELAKNGFVSLVSTTTRRPRVGERDGVDYHFVTREAFLLLLHTGGLIENVEYNNHFYGVSAQEVMRAFDQGKPAVLVAEPHGCEQIHDICSQRGWTVLRVFVNNPIPVLMERMLRRFYEDVRQLDPATPEGAQALAEKIDAHGGRIVKIVTDEQEQWVAPAYSGETHYDLIIDEFDQNQPEVVRRVQEMVENLAPTAAPASLPDPPRRPRP